MEYVNISQTILDTCKTICSIKPTLSNMNDIKTEYTHSIVQFVDIVDKIDKDSLWPLCISSNEKHECDSTFLGIRMLFGHMIHFIQDHITFQDLLQIPEYQYLSDLVDEYIVDNEDSAKRSMNLVMKDVGKKGVVKTTREVSIMYQELSSYTNRYKKAVRNLENGYGNTTQLDVDGLKNNIAKVKKKIENKKQDREEIERNSIPRKDLYSEKLEKDIFNSSRGFKKFRDAVQERIHTLIRNREVGRLKEVQRMMRIVISLRTLDNYCKASRGSSFFNTQQHAMFIHILTIFLRYIESYGHMVLNENSGTGYIGRFTPI